MKVKFNNNFLKFLNLHSFSIYLLQKLVMIPAYKKKNIFKQNNFIQISFEFTAIIILACLFDKHTIFINTIFSSNPIKNKTYGHNITKTINIKNKSNLLLANDKV